ncbi:MAG: hypothetical protein MJ160_05285 [Treponema sp.]|nr:hypothetical protein [Treponema sp.]
MKKIMPSLIVIFCTVFLISCELFPISCFSFKEESKSWGKEYTWASMDSQGEIIFYTYLKPDSSIYGNSAFYIKGPLDLATMKHQYVKEFENPEVKNIEKENGQIKSITINKKKYINSSLK